MQDMKYPECSWIIMMTDCDWNHYVTGIFPVTLGDQKNTKLDGNINAFESLAPFNNFRCLLCSGDNIVYDDVDNGNARQRFCLVIGFFKNHYERTYY